jgi:molybdopterin synthase catalytic subunit/molybdopterin converting factor small subunit
VQVQIRLFAGLRDRAGADAVEVELPEGARVADALAKLEWLTDGLPVVMAVNREYADGDTPLCGDDELALIPPVSGGAPAPAPGPPRAAIHVRLSAEPLSIDAVIARVADPRAGAIVSFSGVTREVPSLEYAAYAEMAERELAAIVAEAIERHGLCAAAAEHRVGTVALSEPSVVIAASAPHRAEAFAGAREIIDRIKAQAPIWKREQGEWVAGPSPSPRASR